MLNLDAVANALRVMILDPKIRAFLEVNDPKALEQAVVALGPAPINMDPNVVVSFGNTHQSVRIEDGWDDQALTIGRNVSLSGGFEIRLDRNQRFDARWMDELGTYVLRVNKVRPPTRLLREPATPGDPSAHGTAEGARTAATLREPPTLPRGERPLGNS